MKTILSILLIMLLRLSTYGDNPLYVTFNKSFLVNYPDEINYHGLQVWKLDRETMTLTFFDTMKSFPIESWEDKEENEKLIIANLGEYSAAINIRSPWFIGVFFGENKKDGTYQHLYAQVFYLEELPDWYYTPGEGKDSYWNW